MSLPKAQLVDPQGNMNLPGMTATGIVTATSLSGVATGSVTNLTGSPDLDVGIVTGSSFVGDGTGHAASLTGTPQLNLGITTSTGFIGDATGKAAGLTGTPNLNVGLITATSFVGFVTGDVTGNISGLAASVTPGVNLGLGVCTAIQYHGDGSALTGAGSSVYIAQEITASGDETIIDLSDGNLIYYKGQADTTVGFASTSPAEQITFIRDTIATYTVAFNESISTGGVNFDNAGDDERLTLAGTADFHFGTNDFTIEAFVNRTADTNAYPRICNFGPYYSNNDSVGLIFDDTDYPNKITFFSVRNAGQGTVPANSRILVSTSSVTTSTWYHVAVTRTSGVFRLFINGVLEDTNSSIPSRDLEDSSTNTLAIAGTVDRMETEPFNGKISNFRIINGTSLYTKTFLPPSAELTNVTNTKLLCCQSTSSTTTAAVTPGTITANNSPTAGAQTVAYSGTNEFSLGSITWPTSITWNGGNAPTLAGANDYSLSGQVFNLVTADGGTTWYGYEEVNNTTLSSNLTLWAWGHNNFGQLGQNTIVSHSSPIQIPGDWSRIPQGQGDAFNAVKPDGTLWTWGNNSNGGLGLNQASPVKISSPTQIGSGTDWARPGGGGDNVRSAVKTDGTLWMWGKNSDGTLGQNERTSRSSPVQVPGTTWSTAAHHLGGTDDAMAAIKTDGTLWTWGSGLYGMLGLNTGHPVRKSSPTQIPGIWTSVGGHNYMMAATKSDGTLWTWGENSPGVLGDNSRTQRSSPVQVPGTNWAAVSPFGGYTIMSAIKTDGTLWAWGNNAYGSLGQNNRTEYSSPVQVGSDTTWKQPAAGGTDGITGAVKTDGTLWTWGYNYAGALGQNLGHGTGTFSSPVQVPGTAWQEVIVNKDGTFALQSS